MWWRRTAGEEVGGRGEKGEANETRSGDATILRTASHPSWGSGIVRMEATGF
jgi:hypothetical protein